MMRFTKACDTAEIKPIIGAQLRIFDDLDRTPLKQRETPNREFRVNVFVKNDAGIKTLYKLLSLANDTEHFYYNPRLSFYELIDALKDKCLCIASGGPYSVFTHEEGHRYWKAIQVVTGPHSAFCELVAINTPYYERINQEAINASNGSPFLLTRPALYLDDDQADTLDILKAITTNTEMSKPYRPIPFVRDLSILKPAELLGHVKAISASMSSRMALPKGVWQQAWKGNQDLADQCAYHWSKQPISLPKMADDEIGELNRQLAEGWKSRLFTPQLGYQPTDLVPYKERLIYELGVTLA
jgi:DNA polymerase-3 subunit alpha